MSILDKCEKIGIELRRTKEGNHVISCLDRINKSPEDLKSEFFNIVNKNYIKLHFYSIPNAIEILKANISNPSLGIIVKRILQIEGLEEFGDSNIPIGNFIENLSITSFSNTVKYQLSKDVQVTPELVRLSNALTVECLRINILQQIIKEKDTNPKFVEIIKRFDDFKLSDLVPFSKLDRKNIKIIKNEYKDTNTVDLAYSLIYILKYIKSMIFDSFYENIFEVDESKDVISKKQKTIGKCCVVKLVMNQNIKNMSHNIGWILKLHSSDGSVLYGQIFHKIINFNQTGITITVKALIHDYL